MLKRLFGSGSTIMFRGARRGQAGMSALGAAVMVVGWLRKRRGPGRELVYARTLRDGEAVTVRLRRGETTSVDVEEHDVPLP